MKINRAIMCELILEVKREEGAVFIGAAAAFCLLFVLFSFY